MQGKNGKFPETNKLRLAAARPGSPRRAVVPGPGRHNSDSVVELMDPILRRSIGFILACRVSFMGGVRFALRISSDPPGGLLGGSILA